MLRKHSLAELISSKDFIDKELMVSKGGVFSYSFISLLIQILSTSALCDSIEDSASAYPKFKQSVKEESSLEKKWTALKELLENQPYKSDLDTPVSVELGVYTTTRQLLKQERNELFRNITEAPVVSSRIREFVNEKLKVWKSKGSSLSDSEIELIKLCAYHLGAFQILRSLVEAKLEEGSCSQAIELWTELKEAVPWHFKNENLSPALKELEKGLAGCWLQAYQVKSILQMFDYVKKKNNDQDDCNTHDENFNGGPQYLIQWRDAKLKALLEQSVEKPVEKNDSLAMEAPKRLCQYDWTKAVMKEVRWYGSLRWCFGTEENQNFHSLKVVGANENLLFVLAVTAKEPQEYDLFTLDKQSGKVLGRQYVGSFTNFNPEIRTNLLQDDPGLLLSDKNVRVHFRFYNGRLISAVDESESARSLAEFYRDLQSQDSSPEKIRDLKNTLQSSLVIGEGELPPLIAKTAKGLLKKTELKPDPLTKILTERLRSLDEFKNLDPKKQKQLEESLLRATQFEKIPKGEFDMGSPENETGRGSNESLHHVKLKGFEMGKTSVTQLVYYLVSRKDAAFKNPAFHKEEKHCPDTWVPIGGGLCPDLPVEQVSWHDAQEYHRNLNELVKNVHPKMEYRLPIEAEREYAARAGTQTRYYFGDDERDLPYFAQINQQQTQPVGTKFPNDFGLHDMHGNVWEWVLDPYSADFRDAVSQEEAVSGKVKEGSDRVMRGGSYGYSALNLRSAKRIRYHPDNWGRGLGFRSLRTEK